MSDPDSFWEDLLSEDAGRIRRAWGNLTDDECQVVLAHLRRMLDEPDWHEAQKRAAEKALGVIQGAV